MTRTSDGTDVPVSPVPASSSNMGSPNGSVPDLDGTGFRACTMEENQRNIHTSRKIAAAHAEYIQIRKLRPDAFPNSGFV